MFFTTISIYLYRLNFVTSSRPLKKNLCDLRKNDTRFQNNSQVFFLLFRKKKKKKKKKHEHETTKKMQTDLGASWTTNLRSASDDNMMMMGGGGGGNARGNNNQQQQNQNHRNNNINNYDDDDGQNSSANFSNNNNNAIQQNNRPIFIRRNNNNNNNDNDDDDANNQIITSETASRLFASFIVHFVAAGSEYIYLRALRDNLTNMMNYLEIDFLHIRQYSESLARAIEEAPIRTIAAMEQGASLVAVENKMFTPRHTDHDVQIQIYTGGSVKAVALRQLSSSGVAKLICVSGIVVKASVARPRCARP